MPGYALLGLALFAQAPENAPDPPWTAEFLKLQREVHQRPPAGIEAQVEGSWRAALQTPRHPQFPSAVLSAAHIYGVLGYDLKAEQALRQALSALGPDQRDTRRNLTLQLASLFEQTEQLRKALAIRQQLANQPPANSAAAFYDKRFLANLYERMGEMEKAEEAWKEVASWRPASTPPPHPRSRAAAFRGNFGVASRNELASFYARRGRVAEAEVLYRQAVADAARTGSLEEWNGAAASYIGFLAAQRRFGEAVELGRESLERTEASPDPSAFHVANQQRQQLADLLVQAGSPAEALALQEAAAVAARGRGFGSPEHMGALASLGYRYAEQGRLEEAERMVAELREAGATAPTYLRAYESTAVTLLARIRDAQKNPEEANRLRATIAGPAPAFLSREPTLYSLLEDARRAALEGNSDAALALVARAKPQAAERAPANWQEVGAFLNVAQALLSRQKEAEARAIAVEACRLLEQAQDHPRLADALGPVIFPLDTLGLRAEAESFVERLEKILTAAKGPDSPALNAVETARITLMQRDGNWAEVIELRKRILTRMEQVSGPKSHGSLTALRELAFAYAQTNNWPQEERLFAPLLERMVNLTGPLTRELASLLEHMANRAAHQREFDQALAWMDQALEIARALPDQGAYAMYLQQNRERLVRQKNLPPANPPLGSAETGMNQDHRWFTAGPGSGSPGQEAEVKVLLVPQGAVQVADPERRRSRERE